MFDENPLGHDQDAVLQDYQNSPTLAGTDWQALHMFFSPLRIPVGLTDEEIRICVLLYPLRKDQIDRRLAMTENAGLLEHLATINSLGTFTLPDEFSPDKVMDRERFKEGIWKFLLQAHT